MSKKLPLYAVDKCPMTVRVPVEVKVKLDQMAEDTGERYSISGILPRVHRNLRNGQGQAIWRT